MPGRRRFPLGVSLIGAVLGAAVLALPLPAGAVVGHEVSIARGIEHINAGRYAEALEDLKAARQVAPDNNEALFYSGVAYARLGEYMTAEGLLLRALQLHESAEPYFELGRVAALTGRCDEAGRLFDRFAALDGDEAGRTDGTRLLDGCRSRLKRQPAWLSLGLGWQHDSNVVLDPDNPATPREGDKDDHRGLATLSAGLPLAPVRGLELVPAYGFYGSLHARLHDYNALYQKIDVPLTITSSALLRPTLGYSAEYTLFDGDRYSVIQTGYARLALAEGAAAVTEALAEYRDNRFWDSDLFPDNEGRSGGAWSAGARQAVRWGRLEARLHGLYDRDDADEEHWVSRGWHAGARVDVRVAEPLTVSLTGEYAAKDYRAIAPAAVEKREDRTTTYTAGVNWAFSRRASATIGGSYTSDDSNLEAYTFDRTIVGIALTVGL